MSFSCLRTSGSDKAALSPLLWTARGLQFFHRAARQEHGSRERAHTRARIAPSDPRSDRGGEGPILGYEAAAKSIGLDGDYSRHMGQVCSRIDAAAFVTGWPMLSVHMVRKANGDVNHDSFSMRDWPAWHDEVIAITTTHKWTVQQVDEILRELDGLPRNSAQLIWKSYERGSAFIRWNLHRKLREK